MIAEIWQKNRKVTELEVVYRDEELVVDGIASLAPGKYRVVIGLETMEIEVDSPYEVFVNPGSSHQGWLNEHGEMEYETVRYGRDGFSIADVEARVVAQWSAAPEWVVPQGESNSRGPRWLHNELFGEVDFREFYNTQPVSMSVTED